ESFQIVSFLRLYPVVTPTNRRVKNKTPGSLPRLGSAGPPCQRKTLEDDVLEIETVYSRRPPLHKPLHRTFQTTTYLNLNQEQAKASGDKINYSTPRRSSEDLGRSRGRYSTGKAPSSRHRESHRPSPYSRPNEFRSRDRHQLNNKRLEPQYYRETNLRRIDDRSSQWRKSQSYNHYDKERSSHTSAFHGGHEPIHQPFPSETRHHSRDRGLPNSREEKEDSSASRKAQQESARGTPLQIPEDNLPKEAIAEAIGELHDVMKLYTSVADPTESAARKERYRLAQEQGEIEQTAAQMVRARLTNQDNGDMVTSPTRVPALLRLGPSPPPLASHPTGPVETRRKPGRPSGSRKKAPNSPNMLMGSSSKKRKQIADSPLRRRRLVCLPPAGIATGQLAPWILWHLWLARNEHIFNNKEVTPATIIGKAVAAAREWLQAQETTSTETPTRQQEEEPTILTTSTIVQTDAAWREDLQLAGLGWCVGERNEKLSILAHCHYVSSPLVAEGLALREALQFCIEKNIRMMRCETDSLVLIKALNSGPPVAELYGIVADIACLSLAFDSISFSWIKRGKNGDADALAKQTLWNASKFMLLVNNVS
ncbi:hypothetical protein IGI04_017862, partial [Brassica rapa subsp. trilocularis]